MITTYAFNAQSQAEKFRGALDADRHVWVPGHVRTICTMWGTLHTVTVFCEIPTYQDTIDRAAKFFQNNS